MNMGHRPVHCAQDPLPHMDVQILHRNVSHQWVPCTTNIFFSNFSIKKGSHGTIYTFKNYFAIVFLVFSKISGIQMDP